MEKNEVDLDALLFSITLEDVEDVCVLLWLSVNPT